jgi:hypothetical protein
MSEVGQKAKYSLRADVFRFGTKRTSLNGVGMSVCPTRDQTYVDPANR